MSRTEMVEDRECNKNPVKYAVYYDNGVSDSILGFFWEDESRTPQLDKKMGLFDIKRRYQLHQTVFPIITPLDVWIRKAEVEQ